MRHITKTTAPQSLERWKKDNKSKTYSDLGKEQAAIKNELKQQLIEEQKYICCYCEREIDVDNSHIEHFEPQSVAPNLQLDYSNLLISCCDTYTCGHIKKSVSNPELISPIEIDSLSHFAFGVDGSIMGKDSRGVFTREALNINNEALKKQRKSLIDSFRYLLMGGIENEAEKYIIETDGKYNKFYSAIEYLHKAGTI